MNVWYQALKDPSNPCVNNCNVSSKTGFCIGCGLTIKEIMEWDNYSIEEKLLIMDKIKERNENLANV